MSASAPRGTSDCGSILDWYQRLEPPVAERFIDIDGKWRRRSDRKEALEIRVEVTRAERRAERWQHRQARLLAEFMATDQRLRAAAAEQHHGAAIDLRLQGLQKCLQLKGATKRTEHDQVGAEVAQHGSDIGCAGFARDEAEFVKHVGEKHPHVGSVLDDACTRRNRPAAELDDLAAALPVVARHGPVPHKINKRKLRGAYDIHRRRALYAKLHNPPNDSFRG